MRGNLIIDRVVSFILFKSYRRSPVFDATAHEISAKDPLEPLGSSSLPVAADEVIE